MRKNKYAFSLIEVIIATAIISVTVFWVYKLIWENTKIISNSWNYLQLYSLFPVIEWCIENLNSNFTWTIWIYYFYLGNNIQSCEYNSSWTIIDNIEYKLSWEITSTWISFTDWKLIISSDEVKTQTWIYKQIKK